MSDDRACDNSYANQSGWCPIILFHPRPTPKGCGGPTVI